MKRIFCLATLAAFSVAHADLTIGSTAPALKVANVVKGKAVNLSKGLHVVEFWATWCGPCRQSIPHLTQLAKKYKGKVDFTGVSVWENGKDQLGQVKKFVAEMGATMDYNVSFDGDAKYMTKQWMEAAGQNGIPASFLVKDGKVIWIGHPMAGLEETIDQVLKGTYDVAKAKKALDEERKQAELEAKAQKELSGLLKDFNTAIKNGDMDGATSELEKVIKDKPAYKWMLMPSLLQIMCSNGDARQNNVANELAQHFWDNGMELNTLAWTLIDPDSNNKSADPKVALKIATRANELTKGENAMVLDTYALALWKNGMKAEALAAQTKAVDLAKKMKGQEELVKDLQSRLDMYKKG
ncbi:MAG: redoxin family protein [Armatimonadetes bacterium]|nr:redoxin family protein [Armatimonadota bacterium]